MRKRYVSTNAFFHKKDLILYISKHESHMTYMFMKQWKDEMLFIQLHQHQSIAVNTLQLKTPSSYGNPSSPSPRELHLKIMRFLNWVTKM